MYLLTESDRTALFSNLEDILFANTGFLQDLEERFNSGTEFSIGDIFLKHVMARKLQKIASRAVLILRPSDSKV